MTLIEQKHTKVAGRNGRDLFTQLAYQQHKKLLVSSNFQFDPRLVAAIIKREPSSIKSILGPNQAIHHETLRESQYEALRNYYGNQLLANPIKLALQICDSDTTEMTQSNDATRYDILHCLAENFDKLVESARQKGHSVPDLADILAYAQHLQSSTPLHTFILGLSDDNKERAQFLMQKEMAIPAIS